MWEGEGSEIEPLMTTHQGRHTLGIHNHLTRLLDFNINDIFCPLIIFIYMWSCIIQSNNLKNRHFVAKRYLRYLFIYNMYRYCYSTTTYPCKCGRQGQTNANLNSLKLILKHSAIMIPNCPGYFVLFQR